MKKTMRLIPLVIILFCFKARAGSYEGIDSSSYDTEGFVDRIENIDKIPTASLESTLQGKFASLYVQNISGAPGSQQPFSIRNVGTGSTNSFPLVILNGMPIFQEASSITGTNPLSTINVDDIRSIEVIKDASALAIYGARGANGVIVVNTKQETVKSAVNFNLSNGVSVNGDIYRDVVGGNKELNQLRGLYDNRNLLNPDNPVDYPLFVSDPKNSFFRANDWQEDQYNLGKYLNYNFGLSGSGVFGFYNVTVGVLSQDGITDESKFTRYNLSINSRYNVSEKFGFDFYINGTQANRTGEDIKLLSPAYAPFSNDPVFPPNVFVADNATLNENVNNHVFSNAKAFFHLTDSWDISTTVGMVYENYRRDYFQPSTLNNGTISASAASSQSQRFFSRSELDYQGKDNRLNAKFGFEFIQTQQDLISVSGSRSGSAFSDFVKIVGGYSRNEIVGGTDIQKYNLMSGYGVVDFKPIESFTITGTVRADGSSQYSSDNQWKVFPGVGLDWDLINNKDSYISNVALRGSGAVLGITEDTGARFPGSIASIGSYRSVEGPVTTFGYNEDLSAPISKQLDVGFDLRFKGGLWLSAEAYSKQISDYIISVPAPQGSMYTWENGMDVTIKGIELSMGLTKQIGNLTWSSTFVASAVRSEIDRILPNSMSGMKEGEALTAIYAYKANGKLAELPISTKTGEVLNFNGAPFQIGLPNILDSNNDQFINEKDRSVVANAQPRFTGGWNNHFNFKRFYFDAQLNFAVDGEIIQESYSERYANDTYEHSLFADDGELTPYYFLRSDDEGGMQIQGISSIDKVSFLRLSNLTLGYTFAPTDFFKIKDINIYSSATNLLAFSNYEGINPEENLNAISQFDLSSTGSPLFTTIVLGVKVKF